MARNFGRFTTSIWRDPDFISLTLPQQAVYFTLGLQSDVSAAGTLPFTARRWAKLSAGTTRDEIEALIASLAEHAGRHLVVDVDTEELLIRKFIKWDQGWYNEKRWPQVRDAVGAISSPQIRDIAVDELRKLALSDGVSDGASRRVLDWLSDGITGFDRLRVTEGDHIPEPLTGNREREPSIVGANADPPSMFCSKHPEGTEEPCRACATARERYAAWAKAKTEREVETKRAAADARRNCTDCDERGMRLDPKTRLPAGRCDHRKAAS